MKNLLFIGVDQLRWDDRTGKVGACCNAEFGPTDRERRVVSPDLCNLSPLHPVSRIVNGDGHQVACHFADSAGA